MAVVGVMVAGSGLTRSCPGLITQTLVSEPAVHGAVPGVCQNTHSTDGTHILVPQVNEALRRL